MHEVAGAEARGEQRAREAPEIVDRESGFVNRSRRRVDVAGLWLVAGGETAERAAGLLQLDQIRFARQRQAAEALRVDDVRRGHLGERFGVSRRVLLHVLDLLAQGRELGGGALVRAARFEAVVKISHVIPPPERSSRA